MENTSELKELASSTGFSVKFMENYTYIFEATEGNLITREDFLRKNIVAVSFFQNCNIHTYS